ncbi:Exonuclease SbcC [Streptomyces misionensis JCM 4497]
MRRPGGRRVPHPRRRGGHRSRLGGPAAAGAGRPDRARTLRLRRQFAQRRRTEPRTDRGAGRPGDRRVTHGAAL